MKLKQPNADIYIPDGAAVPEAFSRTTHLAITAHQDDIEILAYHGIAECYGRKDAWFAGVVATNGAGSPRAGIYADHSDDEMQRVRRLEQRRAAYIGDYSAQFQLDYPSAMIKDASEADAVDDLIAILRATKPRVVYLHNLADKHDTHIGVTLRSIAALRAVRDELAIEAVYGCEVWRDLDWMLDDEKIALPVSERPNMAAALIGVFDSQVSGGKRYDLAIAGRRMANATFFASHATDAETALTFAMDLKPLIDAPTLSPAEHTLAVIERFKNDVADRIRKFS